MFPVIVGRECRRPQTHVDGSFPLDPSCSCPGWQVWKGTGNCIDHQTFQVGPSSLWCPKTISSLNNRMSFNRCTHYRPFVIPTHSVRSLIVIVLRRYWVFRPPYCLLPWPLSDLADPPNLGDSPTSSLRRRPSCGVLHSYHLPPLHRRREGRGGREGKRRTRTVTDLYVSSVSLSVRPFTPKNVTPCIVSLLPVFSLVLDYSSVTVWRRHVDVLRQVWFTQYMNGFVDTKQVKETILHLIWSNPCICREL